MRTSSAALALAFCLLGCGDEADLQIPETCGSASDSFLPLTVGNQWRYQSAENGEIWTKTQSIAEEMTPTGETEPVLVQVTHNAGKQDTETWLRVDGTRVLRVRESDTHADGTTSYQTFVPGKLRIDLAPERLAEGASWTESYERNKFDETSGAISETDAIVETWTVVSAGEVCPSPAQGSDCVHLRMSRPGVGQPPTIKQYWFAPGLGKVREEGARTELLTDCSLGDAPQ